MSKIPIAKLPKNSKMASCRIKSLLVVRDGFKRYYWLWEKRGYNLYEMVTPKELEKGNRFLSLDYYPYWAMTMEDFKIVNRWFNKKIKPLIAELSGLITEKDTLWPMLRTLNEKDIIRLFNRMRIEWKRRPPVGKFPQTTDAISPYKEIDGVG